MAINISYLQNGIPVVFNEISSSRSFSIGVCCKAGVLTEMEGEAGLSHFVEHLLFRGYKERSRNGLSFIGGSLNAFTTKEFTVYYSKVLSEFSETAIEVLGDMILNPIFSDKNIEKEKRVILEEIKSKNISEEALVHEVNISNLFVGSNLSKDVIGSEEDIEKITKEKIEEYFNRLYTSENIFISIAGKFEKEKLLASLNRAFSSIKAGNKNLLRKDIFAPNLKPLSIPTSGNRAYICVNTEGLPYTSEDYHILQIVGHVLGYGHGSRLFEEVRYKKAIAYSIYSYLSTFSHSGALTTYIETDKDNASAAIDIVISEYNKFKHSPITEKELERAKNQIVANMIFNLEDSMVVMLNNLEEFFFHETIDNIKDTESKVLSTTTDDIMEFSKKHFSGHESYTILGNVC